MVKTIQEYVICDCLDKIESLSNIQAIITSPPYFNSAKKYQRGIGVHYSKDVGEPLYVVVEMMEKGYKIVKDNGFAFINLGFSYGETGVLRPFYIVNEIQKRTNWFCVDTIIWHKNNPIPIQGRLTNAFEYIFVFTKNPIFDYIKKITYEHNVWEFPVQQGSGNAIFPLELAERCILLGSKEGDWILDPFLGTGTTLLACRLLDRNGFGYELNQDNEQVIREKLGMNNMKIDDFNNNEDEVDDIKNNKFTDVYRDEFCIIEDSSKQHE